MTSAHDLADTLGDSFTRTGHWAALSNLFQPLLELLATGQPVTVDDLAASAGQPAAQGHDGEDLEPDAPLERQALNDVKAVEFGSTPSHRGEVPPRRWRRPADPPPGIKGAPAFQDAANGPHRRQPSVVASHELTVDGPGSVLAQIARGLQLAPQNEHEVLQRRVGPMDPFGERRPIAPLDTIQGTIPGTSIPPLHGGETHRMCSGHRSHRRAGPDLRDHRASPRFPSPSFLPIASTPRGFTPAS